MTSILKLGNSIYLSWAFQLNEGFSRTGPPCLCFSGSLGLVVLVAVLAPMSASLSDIITVVAALTTAWLTIACMSSDSSISASFQFL